MRRGFAWVSVIALCAVAACSGPSGPEFSRADGDTLRKRADEFAAAFNAKDLDKVVSFFAGTGVLMPPNASTVRGQESIRGYYESRLAGGATDLAFQTKDVGGYGSIGYVSGDYSLRFVPTDGKPPTRDRGKFLWVLRNAGGNWRSEYKMFSSDLPAPVASGSDQP